MKSVPLLTILLTASPALAEPANLAVIARGAEAFAGQPLQAPDPRLRLAACPTKVEYAWYGNQQESVVAQCPMAGGWRLYLNRARALQPAPATVPAIQRGDPVTISLGGQGFAVSLQGEALEPGATGSWIRVRTVSGKGDVLRARVLQPGRVGIDLP